VLKKLSILCIFALLSSLITGCGYRGDLYLPDEAQQNQTDQQDGAPAEPSGDRN
tara:strand:- start:393 stop:554 length:162 start_codon:yes stop_codon:yes gene_type:complete